jgi:2-keto-4-pentenoate hydratase/2-oxohepta-3-ene-1,7-dioic acid hydratase in catechol pathway
MRLARWTRPGDATVREGLVVGSRVAELPTGTGIQDLLEAGLARALEIGAEVEAGMSGAEDHLDAVTLLPPLRPATIRDFVTFEEHVEGMTASPDGVSHVPDEWYEFPTFYFTNPNSVLATGDVVVFPAAAVRRDFELEVAAVIGAVPGRDGAHLAPEEAGAHIFGYTIMNDWSARDVQAREMAVRLGPAKGKDFATTLGPVLVTADEVADLADADGFLQLELEVLVNGVTIGTDLLGNMGWRSSSPTPAATRGSCPATCSAPAPRGAAASPNCGAARESSCPRRSSRATRSSSASSGSGRSATSSASPGPRPTSPRHGDARVPAPARSSPRPSCSTHPTLKDRRRSE